MRLCSYVVKWDVGLAPNPFWGYCTLAVCTPNHMGIRPKKGDWFMGTQPVDKGSNLIYAMQVSEILPFESYFSDPRFEKKKPKKKGARQELYGDNMYYLDEFKEWQQHPSWNHTEPGQQKQDLKHPYVFIGKKFYYFGDNAVQLPLEYQSLIRTRQGCKCSYDPEIVKSFLNWLAENFEPGLHGDPSDWPKRSRTSVELIDA